MEKRIVKVNRGSGGHWVGDGFPVETLLSYAADGEASSPFLLLDYAGPAEFEPSESPRGVEIHPHRGFETVTIVFQGEVEHRDNAGNSGKIGPGDVQWMTAARGILHEEMHGREFTRAGGTLEMIQLWVNLPARHKMGPPKYQELLAAGIPAVALPDDGGRARVIAGNLFGTAGPASTFTPINLWDLSIVAGKKAELPVPSGYNCAVCVLKGELKTGGQTLLAKQLALYSPDGDRVVLDAVKDSVVVVLSGEPIREPIAGAGPFVMNTREEIRQAMADYQSGRFSAG